MGHDQVAAGGLYSNAGRHAAVEGGGAAGSRLRPPRRARPRQWIVWQDLGPREGSGDVVVLDVVFVVSELSSTASRRAPSSSPSKGLGVLSCAVGRKPKQPVSVSRRLCRFWGWEQQVMVTGVRSICEACVWRSSFRRSSFRVVFWLNAKPCTLAARVGAHRRAREAVVDADALERFRRFAASASRSKLLRG